MSRHTDLALFSLVAFESNDSALDQPYRALAGMAGECSKEKCKQFQIFVLSPIQLSSQIVPFLVVFRREQSYIKTHRKLKSITTPFKRSVLENLLDNLTVARKLL